MDFNAITTKTILEVLGINILDGLPKRGNYTCFLDIYKCDLENYNGNLFDFQINVTFPRGMCIEIPDGTIKDIVDNDLKFHKDLYALLLEFIHHKSKESKNYPESLVVVCFSILHEFGHWEYFIKCDLTLEEYIEKDKLYREKNRMLKATDKEKFIDYRNIPSEKAADEFACGKLLNLISYLMK